MIDNSSPMPNIATPTNYNCARPSCTWPPAPTIYLAEYDTFRLRHYQDYQIRKLSDLRLSTDRTLSKLSDHQIINRSHLIKIIRSSDYQQIASYQNYQIIRLPTDRTLSELSDHQIINKIIKLSTDQTLSALAPGRGLQ